ncbi:MAG TPA: MFS transporter, partial [Tessaracoccus flavescens]|nr:MFS transporter [Tessaracoccus flavescens]
AMALSPTKPVIFVASFFIGISVQAFKICVDTLVQAHVDEEFKGRAFTFYDMAFNSALVLAGVVAALTLPPTGLSVLGFVAMAALYAACAVAMAVVSARIGRDTLEKGTEDLVAR